MQGLTVNELMVLCLQIASGVTGPLGAGPWTNAAATALRKPAVVPANLGDQRVGLLHTLILIHVPKCPVFYTLYTHVFFFG